MPRLVSTDITWKPVLGTVSGGVPTFLKPAGRLGAGDADGSTIGFQLQVAVVAAGVGVALLPESLPVLAMNTHVTTTSRTTAAATAPMRTCRLRRSRLISARSAISRSSLARAAARWRS